MKNKKAFTLAEVLITLTIIGVIAAITIPTLMQNYKEAQVVSGLQKAYTTFANAFAMAKAEHGDFSNWSWNQIPSGDEKRIQYFWETYGFPYLKVVDKCFPLEERCFLSSAKYTSGGAAYRPTSGGGFILSDGTSVMTWAAGDAHVPHIRIVVDINGPKGPNITGKDIFDFFFVTASPNISVSSTEDENYNSAYSYPIGFSLAGEGLSSDVYGDSNKRLRIALLDGRTSVENNACSTTTGSGRFCGAWIKANGWKIPKGYPKI